MSDDPKIPPAPPRPARQMDSGVTMPAELLDMIKTRGVLAVFIPADEGIRFFVTQKFSTDEANEFAEILEDCANTIRAMFRPPPGRVQ